MSSIWKLAAPLSTCNSCLIRQIFPYSYLSQIVNGLYEQRITRSKDDTRWFHRLFVVSIQNKYAHPLHVDPMHIFINVKERYIFGLLESLEGYPITIHHISRSCNFEQNTLWTLSPLWSLLNLVLIVYIRINLQSIWLITSSSFKIVFVIWNSSTFWKQVDKFSKFKIDILSDEKQLLYFELSIKF